MDTKNPKLRLIFLDLNKDWKKTCTKIYDEIGLQTPWKSEHCQTEILWDEIDIRNVKKKYPSQNGRSCAFISPANTFGAMDGGIDKIYSDMFVGPPRIQRLVQTLIREETIYYDSATNFPILPVGSGIMVPVPKNKNTFLISVPTMFIPDDVSCSQNAYYATLAALCVTQKYNSNIHINDTTIRFGELEKDAEKIDTLYIPGMCTGTGNMTLDASINQMMRAVEDWEHSIHSADCSQNDQSAHCRVFLPKDVHLMRNVFMSGSTVCIKNVENKGLP